MSKEWRKKRKSYFVHPSLQIKYIAMSVLPALVVSLFCTYFLIKSGELILEAEKNKIFIGTSSVGYMIQEMEIKHYPPDTIQKMRNLKKELVSLQNILRITYFDTMKEWKKIKYLILAGLTAVLVIVGLMSLLWSHRIAGPLLRLTSYVNMLAEGKDIPQVRIRRYDEFKELAAALEKLRKRIKR